MHYLSVGAEAFIGLFQEGGKTFVGMVTGIIPTLIVLITGVNALIRLIGEEKVNNFAAKCANNFIARYTIFPIVAMFFLTNPMAYTFGKFLPEDKKVPWFDACISFCHPITGLFPHANPAELFVWGGISAGITTLGLSTGDLAIRYFLVGVVVIFIRGMVTERIYNIMNAKNTKNADNSSSQTA